MNIMAMGKGLRAALGAGAALALSGILYAALRPAPLRLEGIVDANQIVLSAQAPGRVLRLLVEEGQEVRAGELLAILESTELAAATAATVAQAGSLESQVQGARASAAGTVGEMTHGLEAARAAQAMAVAALAEAAANRRRQEDLTRRMVLLAQQGAVALQDRDAAVRTLEAAEAHERAAAQGVAQAGAALDAAAARRHQGRAALDNVGALRGQLASARATVAGAQARQDFTRVYAPVAGRVGTVVARPGEFAALGAPLLTLMDLSQTWVYAALPETRAEGINVGDALTVTLASGTRVRGRVLAKAVEADFATQRDVGGPKRDIRAVRIKLLIPNPGGRFVPGLSASVTP